MNKINYKALEETLYYDKLNNGLDVYLLPKAGYNKTYATITTPLGSNVTKYSTNGTVKEIPLGVAHFLEHKLFDIDGQDISEEFSLHDARVNAFTTNTRTTYLFSCTKNLNKNLDTLLNFVLNPTFTEEGIKKELGIITQEIKMYEDDPNTIIYMNLLKNMYKNHPVRNDILGTEESIKTITKEILTDVHSTFYNPKNMILFITGNIDVDETISFLKGKNLSKISPVDLKIINDYNEPNNIINPDGKTNKNILQPNCLLGIKQKPMNLTDTSVIKQELTYSILFDLMIGKSTENYHNLITKGLINDSFGTDITFDQSYSYFLVGSNSDHPEELYKNLRGIIKDSLNSKVDEVSFKRIKKQIIGGFINALNSLEYIANQFTKYHYLNGSLFDILDIAKEITINDIEKAKETLSDDNLYSTYTVMPK